MLPSKANAVFPKTLGVFYKTHCTVHKDKDDKAGRYCTVPFFLSFISLRYCAGAEDDAKNDARIPASGSVVVNGTAMQVRLNKTKQTSI